MISSGAEAMFAHEAGHAELQAARRSHVTHRGACVKGRHAACQRGLQPCQAQRVTQPGKQVLTTAAVPQ